MTLAPLPLHDTVAQAQRRASDPQASVWVGASAGSGKTKVLADRVTRLLLDGAAPSRLLCLTFTRAAAAEMAVRLTARLSRWATCSDADLDADLDALQGHAPKSAQRERARRLFAQVLDCPGGLRLQTIHGFAQEILRRFPVEAHLPPHFAVMEEQEARALQDETLTALFHTLAIAPPDTTDPAAHAFARLSQTMAMPTLAALVEEIKDNCAKIERALHDYGGLDGMMAALAAFLGLAPEATPETLIQHAVQEGAFDRAGLLAAARAAATHGGKTSAKLGERILMWLALPDAQSRLAAWADYESVFITNEGGQRQRLFDKDSAKAMPEGPAILDVEAQRLLSLRIAQDATQTVERTRDALTLGLAATRAYAARKAVRAALDYDDLIARARALLTQSDKTPWVLYKLDGGLDHLLVDEAQDTNPAQWEIVAALAEEFFAGQGAHDQTPRTLFVVGDEKQSIYSFQGADVSVFTRMRAHFAKKITQAQKPFDEVPLSVSFRSAPAILRAVDAVFASDTARAGVASAPIAHSAFRAQAVGRVEVWPPLVPPKDEAAEPTEAGWELPDAYEPAQDPAAELAELIAQQIKAWVRGGAAIEDRATGALRPMGYGDILVLVQSRGPFVYHLVRSLKKLDVDVSGIDRMALSRQLAVMDLLAALQFALLPEDDLTLACVLRGPLISAREDDLITLAAARPKGVTLWDRLRASAEPTHSIWRDYLAALAARADTRTPFSLLTHLLAAPCPADAISGRRAIATRLGPEAEDPIDELLAAAQAFAQRAAPSLQGFLHELLTTTPTIKREMEGAGGRVRIATVHASKGLEAPVVILPDTLAAPDRGKLDKLLWHDRHNVPVYLPREPLHPKLRALREAAMERRREEYRRLLYVALTRAEGRLLIAGFETRAKAEDKNNGEDAFAKETWYSLIHAGLAPLHQSELPADPAAVRPPALLLADTALPLTIHKPSRPAAHAHTVSTPPLSKPLLPDWARQAPPEEPTPPRPLIPSRPSAQDEAQEPPHPSPRAPRLARGRLVHRLLQILPDLPPEKRATAAHRLLAAPMHRLSPEEQTALASEVLALLSDHRFAPLFGETSRAEQPLIGLAEDRLIAGQVDRLAFVGEEVWIVDYKTNRPPPTDAAMIPAPYRSQMEAYRLVLGALYPTRKIRCFILWTYTAALVEVV